VKFEEKKDFRREMLQPNLKTTEVASKLFVK